jgi:hypothetical protein
VEREGAEWVEGWGQGGEMTQALYAHMNKTIKIKKVVPSVCLFPPSPQKKGNANQNYIKILSHSC